MVTRRVFFFLILAVLLLNPGRAGAFSLGKLQVDSRMGEPLRAAIVIHPQAGERNFKAIPGELSDYALLHVQRSPILDRLRVTVARVGGERRIELHTDQTVDSDGFDLLLRVSSNHHTSFPVFRVDIPTPDLPHGARVAPKVNRLAVHRSHVPVIKPAKRTFRPSAPLVEKNYGPIKVGEHLTGIARRIRRETGNSIFQIMAALVARNPDRFILGNMNSLIEGSVLKIPPPEVIGRIDDRVARRLRYQHARHWLQPREERRKRRAPAPPELPSLPMVPEPVTEPPPTDEPEPVTERVEVEPEPVASEPVAPKKKTPKAVEKPPEPVTVAESAPAPVVEKKTAPVEPAEPAPTPQVGKSPELEAILEQLRVITRVLEDNKGQWNQLESRVAALEKDPGSTVFSENVDPELLARFERRLSALEQARKEWDSLEGRVVELELVEPVAINGGTGTVTATAGDRETAAGPENRFYLMVAAAVAVGGLLLAAFLTWMGRRWNRADHWSNLRALLSSLAQKEPDLLVEALRETEPVFDKDGFVPSIQMPAPGVSPKAGKRSVPGNVGKTVRKLRSVEAGREDEFTYPG